MPRRCLFRSIVVLLTLFTGAAHADDGASPTAPLHARVTLSTARPRSWLFTHEVPAFPVTALKPAGIVGGLTKLVSIVRPAVPREKTDREREAAALPKHAIGVSPIGASIAGFGASVGATAALARRHGIRVPVMLGPRLYAGGGGFAVSMKW